MRHANVSTTMNVYGNSSLRAKQEANSKVVQMVGNEAGGCLINCGSLVLTVGF
jgi:hypothetical protein